MRVVAISDTHNFTRLDLPKGDILIHCGDALMSGEEWELERFNDWLKTLKFKHIIYVAGNHDRIFEKDKKRAKAILSHATYLEDRLIQVEGFKIYGSPWTPTFLNWAFMLPEEELKLIFSRIPKKVDILVTHSPPAGILDAVTLERSVGSEALYEAVMKVKPRYHLFGHIHESYGSLLMGPTQFYNCAIMNGGYRPINKPIVFDITK